MSLLPPQEAVLGQGLLETGFSWVLQMPTGSGKTWLAEQAMRRTVEGGLRAIYLAPIRALAQELYDRWCEAFSCPVGIFTGDYGRPGRPYPVAFHDARILILTPERLDACTRHWRSHWHWLPEVDLLVVDELHTLGDGLRGARLEGALSRFRRLNPLSRVLGMSATLGNRTELATWLEAVEFQSDWRPVPLQWRIERFRSAQEKPELLLRTLRGEAHEAGRTLVFVQSRRRAEALAKFLNTAGISAQHHHAGLSRQRRGEVEAGFRAGAIQALVTTATLEVGLNLPVRSVILYDLQSFDGTEFRPLRTINVWQRVGRAGRPGLDCEGEAILFAPAWDCTAFRYPRGDFEPIQSALCDPTTLSEQIIIEVASGLARTRGELRSCLAQSLASHQRRLPSLLPALETMLDAGMLEERAREDQTGQPLRLRATRLGRIAANQLLSPTTLLALKRGLSLTDRPSFFDLLLIASSTPDCEPVLPVDFEELETLASLLKVARSELLQKPVHDLLGALGIAPKRLLASLMMALAALSLTQGQSIEQVAEAVGCYPSEVHALKESVARILTAMIALTRTTRSAQPNVQASAFEDEPPVHEKIEALSRMLETGLNEHHVTLALIHGIGPTLAHRLVQAGIEDIEDLAQADPSTLTLRGVSEERINRWIEAAEALMRTHTVYRYREAAPLVVLTPTNWPEGIEPYRLRRALDLSVRSTGSFRYRITGGLDPHVVTRREGLYTCDCLDHARGHLCKHILAVRLAQRDPFIRQLVARLGHQANLPTLDLFHLWYGSDYRRAAQ